jgi:hypothetical protein
MLSASGYGSFPAIIKLLARVDKATAEDKIIGNDPASAASEPLSTEEKMQAIYD